MNEFIVRYRDQISGVITGFDRLVFRGNLSLNHEAGMKGYLWANRIAWKDYAQHVERSANRSNRRHWRRCKPVTDRSIICPAAKKARRSWLVPLPNGMALPADRYALLQRWNPASVGGGYATGVKETTTEARPSAMSLCLPLLDRCRVRLYERSPSDLVSFSLYVFLNGREWLARQMDQAGLRYQRHDNCFSWIEDFPRAQTLMDDQLKTNWVRSLDGCAQRTHPLFSELFANYPMSYYWTVFQSEWAMDIVFRDPGATAASVSTTHPSGHGQLFQPRRNAFHGQKSQPQGSEPRSQHRTKSSAI